MTADEAKQALKEGKKVRVIGWKEGFFEEKPCIVDELGEVCDGDIFERYENNDWEIVK